MTTTPTRPHPGLVATAVAVDLACVLLFAAAGRRSHDEGVTAAGVAETAWPFLAGTVVGWLSARGWRAPAAVNPTGVTVWLSTVAVGMELRAGIGAGVAFSFVLVATAVTGLLLVGWRALARVVRR